MYDNQVFWFAFKLCCSDSFALLNQFQKKALWPLMFEEAERQRESEGIKSESLTLRSTNRPSSVSWPCYLILTAVNQSCLSVVYPNRLWLLMLCLKAIFYVFAWSNKHGQLFITRDCRDLQMKCIFPEFPCISMCTMNWLNKSCYVVNLKYALLTLVRQWNDLNRVTSNCNYIVRLQKISN